jgi:hypothetical protein
MDTLPYQLLVIDDTTHALLLVDKQGKIIAEMPYPSEYTPTELVLALDHTKAYMPAIGTNGKGALWVTNLEQQSIYRLPIQLPPPTQFTLAPDGTCAYIATPNGGLYALSLPTLSLKSWGNPAEASCVGLVANHTALYSVWEHDTQGSLAIFSTTGELLHEHPIPGIPTNITLDANNHILVPFTSSSFVREGVMLFTMTNSCDSLPSTVTAQCCLYPKYVKSLADYPSHIATWLEEPYAYVVNEESASITVIDITSASIIRHIEIGRSISCLHILPGGEFGIATSHILGDLSMIDLVNGRLLSVTDTKRELLGYLAIIPSSTT